MTLHAKLFVAAVAAYCLIASAPSWAAPCDEPAELTVNELKLARAVEKRRPIKTGDEFSADGERLYAYLRVANAGAATKLRVIWQRGAKVYHRTTVNVGKSKSWRTWAYIRALRHLHGEWQVRVETPEGDELAQKRFVLER